jgi:hypothetical protein
VTFQHDRVEVSILHGYLPPAADRAPPGGLARTDGGSGGGRRAKGGQRCTVSSRFSSTDGSGLESRGHTRVDAERVGLEDLGPVPGCQLERVDVAAGVVEVVAGGRAPTISEPTALARSAC